MTLTPQLLLIALVALTVAPASPLLQHHCVHDHIPRSALPSYELPYAAHPYAGAAHGTGGRRPLDASPPPPGGAFAPLRLTLEWWGDAGEGAAVNATVRSFLRDAFLPAVASWWSSALQLVPLSAPLAFSPAVSCTSGIAAAPPLTGPNASTDYILRAFIGSPPTGVAPPTPPPDACLAGAQACSTATAACAAATPACVQSGACAAQTLLCAAALQVCEEAATTCAAEAGLKGASVAGVLAFGGACARDSYGRPVAGAITFVPSTLLSPSLLSAASAWAALNLGSASPPAAPSLTELFASAPLLRPLLFVAMHEMCHALGFTADSLHLFRDSAAGGAPRVPPGASTDALGLPQSILATPPERGHLDCSNRSLAAIVAAPGHCVFKLSTPAVAAAARARFGCASLGGAELENQDTSVGSTYGSHWETRLFPDEMMSPILLLGGPSLGVSRATLAFFEDSGWYQPNYDALTVVNAGKAGPEWGANQGCDFAYQKSCLSPVPGAAVPSASSATSSLASQVASAAAAVSITGAGPVPHFCTTPAAPGCSFDLLAKGSCGLGTGTAALLSAFPEYAYFSATATPQAAGLLAQNDYCPIVFPTVYCLTSTTSTQVEVSDDGEVFGPSSRCIMSTLSPSSSNASSASASALPPSPVPACYAVACAPDGRSAVITASLNGGDAAASVRCAASQAGQPSSPLPGFSGSLICPPLSVLCGDAQDLCAGWLYSGTTAGLGIAAAVCVALAALLYTPLRLHELIHSADESDEGGWGGNKPGTWNVEAPPSAAEAPQPPHPDGIEMTPQSTPAFQPPSLSPPPAPRFTLPPLPACCHLPPPLPWTWRVFLNHPLARTLRSLSAAASTSLSARRRLPPGSAVRARQFVPTPGWGAAPVHARLARLHPTSVAVVEIWPPPDAGHLRPGQGWSEELESLCYGGLLRVAAARELQGGGCAYALEAQDFNAPGEQWLTLQRGEAAPEGARPPARRGEPPQPLPIIWSSEWGAEHVQVVPFWELPLGSAMREVAENATPELRAGFAGLPLRRLACGVLSHIAVPLFLCGLEASLRGAALQHRCSGLGNALLTRSTAVALLMACTSYATRLLPRELRRACAIELAPRRNFWLLWAAGCVGGAALLCWTYALNVASASGQAVFGSAGAVAGGSEYAGWCEDGAGGAEGCARRAANRVAILACAAVAMDVCGVWPLLLVLSRHVWRDGVAEEGGLGDGGGQEREEEEEGGEREAAVAENPMVAGQTRSRAEALAGVAAAAEEGGRARPPAQESAGAWD